MLRGHATAGAAIAAGAGPYLRSPGTRSSAGPSGTPTGPAASHSPPTSRGTPPEAAADQALREQCAAYPSKSHKHDNAPDDPAHLALAQTLAGAAGGEHKVTGFCRRMLAKAADPNEKHPPKTRQSDKPGKPDCTGGACRRSGPKQKVRSRR